MTPIRVRNTFLALTALCIVLPILMVVLGIWEPFTLVLGLGVAAFMVRGFIIARRDAAAEARRASLDALERRSETSRTIYVQLIDERGALLPKEERDQRMTEAYHKAGPRDVVVPVTKKT